MEQVEQLLSSDMIAAVNISFKSTFLSMLSAIFCSYLIKVFYTRYGMAMNNRDYFSQTFMLLAITTVSVITIVKSSLALSLGLVGARAIVRFRAAIKEPEELIYLFLIIGLGLAFGSNQFAVGYMLTTAALLLIIISSKLRTRRNFINNANLVVVISGERGLVKSFKDQQLYEILKDKEFIVREMSSEVSGGRIVLETNFNIEDTRTIKLVQSLESLGLDVNVMSGVHIPS